MAQAQPAAERSPTMNCPKCEGKLVATDFQSIKIDVCDECAGVWLDAEEFIHVTQDETDGGWFGRVFR